MLNQPASSAFAQESTETISPGSAGRFRFLLGVFCLAVVIILLRIGWVQSQLQAAYLDALSVTTTEYELIPARDGRILADAGTLAADEELYSVEVHYRWLEEPVNERWLRQFVRDQLTRAEMKDEELQAQFSQTRQQQRTRMWKQLEQISSASATTLQDTRQRIQQRVERIANDVNRRHQERLQQQAGLSVADDETSASPEETNPFLKIAGAIRRAVTTTPHRRVSERIVVREEEDFHAVLRDVPLSIAAEVRAHPERFPGTRVTVATRRMYPQHSLAAHLVGARTVLRDEEQQQLDDDTRVAIGDWVPRRGRTGVEYAWDHRLSGTPGLRKTVRNRRQQIVESTVVRNPAAGRDLVLTIHLELQRLAEQLLAEALGDIPRSILPVDDDEDAVPQPVPAGGCVLVMDVQTGRLIAAASAPDFDLTLFTSGTTEEWDAVNADKRQPFLSRMTGMALPPGSVFKPLTAAAAMENDVLQPDMPFYCQGYLRNPDEHRCLIFRSYGRGHEDITLHRALAQSCNVYFFTAASRTGIEPLLDWCNRFGFGRPTGIDLPFEKSGTLPPGPPPQASEQVRRRFERETLGLAIGQSRLTATPLQIVRMMAAIANGGWLVVPHAVSSDGVARTSEEIDDTPRDLSRQRVTGLHDVTLRAIQEGLTDAVEQPYGTGYRTVRLENVPIAGKSGTAETSPGKPDHAWFAGYVPAAAPQFAFTVVLEHGGSGSRAAGPLVRELVKSMMEHGLIERTASISE